MTVPRIYTYLLRIIFMSIWSLESARHPSFLYLFIFNFANKSTRDGGLMIHFPDNGVIYVFSFFSFKPSYVNYFLIRQIEYEQMKHLTH